MLRSAASFLLLGQLIVCSKSIGFQGCFATKKASTLKGSSGIPKKKNVSVFSPQNEKHLWKEEG